MSLEAEDGHLVLRLNLNDLQDNVIFLKDSDGVTGIVELNTEGFTDLTDDPEVNPAKMKKQVAALNKRKKVSEFRTAFQIDLSKHRNRFHLDRLDYNSMNRSRELAEKRVAADKKLFIIHIYSARKDNGKLPLLKNSGAVLNVNVAPIKKTMYDCTPGNLLTDYLDAQRVCQSIGEFLSDDEKLMKLENGEYTIEEYFINHDHMSGLHDKQIFYFKVAQTQD